MAETADDPWATLTDDERWIACEMALDIYEAVTGKGWNDGDGPDDPERWWSVGAVALVAYKEAAEVVRLAEEDRP